MATLAARANFNVVRKLLFPRFIKNRVSTALKLESATKVCCCFQQTRYYRPYSRIPKKFLKPKNRDKTNRDNVYFLTDQSLPSFTITEALDILKAYDLFGNEPIDMIFNLNMGEGKNKIGVLKGLVHLPNPIAASQKILVFAEGDVAEKAKEAGAAIVGGKELIKQVEAGELEFDHCLCTISFLPNIKHLAKILRNKMPNTRRGTATDDILDALQKYSHGESYIADNNGSMRQTIALTDFSNDQVRQNLFEMIKVVDSHKTMSSDKFYKRVSLIIPPGPKVDLKLTEVLL